MVTYHIPLILRWKNLIINGSKDCFHFDLKMIGMHIVEMRIEKILVAILLFKLLYHP